MASVLSKILRALRSLKLKVFASLLRLYLHWKPLYPTNTANQIVQIPSREKGRTISTYFYRPASNSAGLSQPCPVLINMHGGGFIMGHFGMDEAFCRHVADKAEHLVIDVEYRLAPEHPFPAALNDVEDVVKWIRTQSSDHYDLDRISLSGFSAGGNLALAVSSVLQESVIHSTVAFYPPCDLTGGQRTRPAPDPSGQSIPAAVSRLFDDCYCPPELERSDPRISPTYADPDSFPERTLIITCAMDGLAGAAEDLAKKIITAKGESCKVKRLEKCGHAWNLMKLEPKSAQEKAKEDAFALVLDILQTH